MKQRSLGKGGPVVGEMGFGAWQLNNPMWGGPDRKASVRLVQAALTKGCNFFDTAPNYGDGASETLLGEALAGRREDVVICTKFGHGGPDGEDFSAAALRSSLEQSLRRLKTDFEVRAFGASVDFANELEQLAEHSKSQAAEVLFNVFFQDTRLGFSSTSRRGLGLIVKVPLDSGWLSGTYTKSSRFDGIRERWSAAEITRRAELVEKLRDLLPEDLSLPQAALRFILSHPEVSTLIPGVKSEAQLDANLAAVEAGPLSPELVTSIHRFWESEIADDPLPW